MNKLCKSICLYLLCTSFLFSAFEAKSLNQESLSEMETLALKICEGVIHLFKQHSETIWPGFNLAEQPFLVYLPQKWALLFNPGQEVEGFTPCPKEWPDLGASVLFHSGQYGNLAGQLVFNFKIGGIKTVAIGMPEALTEPQDSSEVFLFGYIVHEAFHQFQYDHFGVIPWEREERYPILDKENTALAYLEMKLLSETLQSNFEGKKIEAREGMRRFAAVRKTRWNREDPFICRYEQGQEIREGTAKYVEMKCIELMKDLEYDSSFADPANSLKEAFAAVSISEYMQDDFASRMTGESISPEDVPRNRIYPVGGALGYLLDSLNIDWKTKAQQAGSEFSFEQLLSENTGIQKCQLSDLLRETKEIYDYEAIVASTEKLIKEYREGYEKALNTFESQKGFRIEFHFNYRSLSRSRSSTTKIWTVDKGTKTLCNHFRIYTLKNDDLLLQIHDAGVFEQNDWDTKRKTVAFFVDDIEALMLDRKPVEIEDRTGSPFSHIEINGKDLKFSFSRMGRIDIFGRRITITFPVD